MIARIVVFALVLIGVACDDCGGDDYGVAGQFDFYVFQQTWPPGFCMNQAFPGCLAPTDYMTKHLTVHGLWPNYNAPQSGHDWPQCCDSPYGPDVNYTVFNQLSAPMHQYWPDEKSFDWPNYKTSAFLQHEWGKHGTCTGLDQYTYYSGVFTIEQSLDTPQFIQDNVGQQVALSDLFNAYATTQCQELSTCEVSFNCKNANLVSVTTCWSQDRSQRIPCPYAVWMNDNCPDTLTVPSF